MYTVSNMWSKGSSIDSCLSVTLTSQTEKAMQFKLTGNTKSFWLPKKAVSVEVNEDGFTTYTLKRWFKKDAWLKNIFDTYAEHNIA